METYCLARWIQTNYRDQLRRLLSIGVFGFDFVIQKVRFPLNHTGMWLYKRSVSVPADVDCLATPGRVTCVFLTQ